jgi:hypothetical protein
MASGIEVKLTIFCLLCTAAHVRDTVNARSIKYAYVTVVNLFNIPSLVLDAYMVPAIRHDMPDLIEPLNEPSRQARLGGLRLRVD